MRPHPDVDLLALHALGEPVLDDAARDHVAGCVRCTDTVGELAGTVRTARGPAHEVEDAHRVAVPAHVWQGISAELGLDPSVRPASVGPSSLRPRGRDDARAAREATVAGPSLLPPPVSSAPSGPPRPDVSSGVAAAAEVVVDLDRRRGRRPGLRLLAVAAAGLVVGAAGTALVVPRLGGDPATDGPAVLAAADLEAFGAGEGTDVQGSARLAALGTDGTSEGTGSTDGTDGTDDRVLQVWLDDLPDTGDGFFEAWLIDPDTGAMVSLGPVRTDGPGEVTAELAVPRGLDVSDYDLVDVSAEPLDGDPTHSGVSLVRGTLGT